MKKKKTKTTDETNDSSEDKNIDFSFQDEDVEKAVDTLLGTPKEKKKPKVHHISEKIQMGMEIKNNLPDKGFLNVKAETATVKYRDRYGEEFTEKKVIITSKDIHDVEYIDVTDGLFNIDFRNDANFWFIRSPVVVPSMITQSTRTHLDIKKCHEPEKRRVELPIWLVIALIGGAAIILIMLFSLFA